ncbi:hypothetical protein TEA_025378 [Camellia sinensis var. sinensis]|uniref:Uncharacterized protein n=1 Tax=Camellia sinensis var. sinensis TaxID=542762 RepID=A0A4S4DKV3_CAMSN|nr:hypothetical protein TEA_025378 [Camellia sinensis var. sinensis]
MQRCGYGIHHVLRESNSSADGLAKLGANQVEPLVVMDEALEDIRGLVIADVVGHRKRLHRREISSFSKKKKIDKVECVIEPTTEESENQLEVERESNIDNGKPKQQQLKQATELHKARGKKKVDGRKIRTEQIHNHEAKRNCLKTGQRKNKLNDLAAMGVAAATEAMKESDPVVEWFGQLTAQDGQVDH